MGPSPLREIQPRPIDDIDTSITAEDTESHYRKTQSSLERNEIPTSLNSSYNALNESAEDRSLIAPESRRYLSSRDVSDDGEDDENSNNDATGSPSEKPVTWRSLPKKGQLAILTFARLSEPLAQTSLQAYMFYQLRSFDPSLPDSTISSQAGILQGSFTAAQFVTAVWWGRLADAEWMGRKKVLMIGLLGTCISCLGFGFSRSFAAAVVFRTLGGVLNSNVGVMRTMIAEIIQEKK
jgi:hypothetical protein